MGSTFPMVRHVYQKINNVADWITTYVAEHPEYILWIDA